MNIKKAFLYTCLATLVAVAVVSCKISYSFSGASIHPDAKTFSVQYFSNNAPMVAPILSPTFTDALKERFQRQTKLSEVRENGDLAFEGEITGYTSTPSSISSDVGDGREGAARNRLTITVRVRFNNALEPQWNFERSFSAFLDYDSSSMLSDVENSLIPEIVDMLIEDIFNAAVANW